MSPATRGIESDTVAMQGQRNQAAAASSGRNFYSTLQEVNAYAGPAAAITAAQYASPQGRDIVATSVNAIAGTPMGLVGTGAAANYGLTGSVNVLPGGGVAGGVSVGGGPGALGAPGAGGGNDTLGMAQNILAESQASNVSMLMVQEEMGQQNRLYTTTSNLMSSRDTMLGNIIRNVRVS